MFSKENVLSVNRHRKVNIKSNVMIVKTILKFACQVENQFLSQNRIIDLSNAMIVSHFIATTTLKTFMN
jgi:hypothetical protein